MQVLIIVYGVFWIVLSQICQFWNFQNGFDYVLTYYDDPQAAFPTFAYKWMASTGKLPSYSLYTSWTSLCYSKFATFWKLIQP